MTVAEIQENKSNGDLKIAGKMIGISQYNAYAALKREGSKHHKKIVSALSKIIEARNSIENELKTPIDESVSN